MSPEELKYYIEQYQARNKGQEALSGWSDKFLIQTIQEGLLENNYDISFFDRKGNFFSGKNAIDGVSGHSFYKAINEFEQNFKQGKSNEPNVEFEVKIVPTSHILMEKMVFYGGADDMEEKEIKSYMDAMAQANIQNSYNVNFSVITGKKLNDDKRGDLISNIEQEMLNNGYNGKGLYMGLYYGVDNLSDLIESSENSNIILSFSEKGFEGINYQFDAPKDYNEKQMANDKAKIEKIIETAVTKLKTEKPISKASSRPIADLEKAISDGINLDWVEEKYANNQPNIQAENIKDKGRLV